MKIKVNGESKDVAEGTRLTDLLRGMELRLETVAVERNLEVVPKREFAECVLQEGDSLEVVTLVGGG